MYIVFSIFYFVCNFLKWVLDDIKKESDFFCENHVKFCLGRDIVQGRFWKSLEFKVLWHLHLLF